MAGVEQRSRRKSTVVTVATILRDVDVCVVFTHTDTVYDGEIDIQLKSWSNFESFLLSIK